MREFAVRFALLLGLVVSALGCGEAEGVASGPLEDEAIARMSLEGIRSSFSKNYLVSDEVFRGELYGMNAAQVQAFLERGPWQRRSWLADKRFGSVSAAEAIVSAAERAGINPLVLLVRLQAEASMINKTRAPSQRLQDQAFGCGCHDGQACRREFRGLRAQLDCAAFHLDKHYDWSVARTSGRWAKGRTKKTHRSERISVTPSNHATAAHYNYTPHVDAARLSWKLFRRFIAHLGTLDPSLTSRGPWIGDACRIDDDACTSETTCRETGGGAGVCAMDCEGTCRDRPGRATTFCVSLDGGRGGTCVAKAEAANGRCGEIPGTERVAMERFVGRSGRSPRSAEVCRPVAPSPGPAERPEPARDPQSEEAPGAWIGSFCAVPEECNFAHGAEIGVCHDAGVCVLDCSGLCPDRAGRAPTFCVSLDGGRSGSCVARPHAINDECGALMGHVAVTMDRFVGDSGVARRAREVCVPHFVADP